MKHYKAVINKSDSVELICKMGSADGERIIEIDVTSLLANIEEDGSIELGFIGKNRDDTVEYERFVAFYRTATLTKH